MRMSNFFFAASAFFPPGMASMCESSSMRLSGRAMSLIVGTWGVIQKSFLDVTDVVYVAFLMSSSDMIPCTPRVGSDNPLIFWAKHLFWYLGFSGFVYMIQGGIFCYNHPQPIVCAVNAPGTLIPVAYRKQAYLFFDLFVQRPEACVPF